MRGVNRRKPEFLAPGHCRLILGCASINGSMNWQLPELLKTRLAHPLPEPLVGSRFEPRPRLGRHYDQPPADARQAAVLILLYPHQGQWHLPLTLRPSQLENHAGQVSLPGGAVESGETSEQAAVREFHEELGAAGLEMEPLGRLTPIYVNVSHFRIEPWVAAASERGLIVPNPSEVEQLLEVPLTHLCDPANFGSRQRQYQGKPYTAPHFTWQSHQIWGATCLILGELITLLEEMGVEN